MTRDFSILLKQALSGDFKLSIHEWDRLNDELRSHNLNKSRLEGRLEDALEDWRWANQEEIALLERRYEGLKALGLTFTSLSRKKRACSDPPEDEGEYQVFKRQKCSEFKHLVQPYLKNESHAPTKPQTKPATLQERKEREDSLFFPDTPVSQDDVFSKLAGNGGMLSMESQSIQQELINKQSKAQHQPQEAKHGGEENAAVQKASAPDSQRNGIDDETMNMAKIFDQRLQSLESLLRNQQQELAMLKFQIQAPSPAATPRHQQPKTPTQARLTAKPASTSRIHRQRKDLQTPSKTPQTPTKSQVKRDAEVIDLSD